MHPKSGHKIEKERIESVKRSVDLVADLLGDFPARVELVHVLRSREGAIPACHPLYAPTGFVQARKKEIEPAFEKARMSLSKAGLPSRRIRSETISGVRSRAEAIAEKATREKFGVIVLGRKGLTRAEEFFIGRVANKLVQMATHPTIWIVP